MSFKISTVVDYNSFIAIDIGSAKIKALICAIENGELRILGSSVYRQSKKNSVGGEISDLYGVSESIKKAINKAGEALEVIPKDVVFSIASPDMLYDTISMNYVREDKSAAITMEEIDAIIKKVEHKSLERVRARSASRIGLDESEMKLITTSVTSITVDGQRITNPIGFAGKNVKLGLMNIFMPLSTANALQNIGRWLGKNIISIIPSIVTIPKIVEDWEEAYDANCFLDLGHTKTTVILENDGEILGGNTLNFGFSLLEEELRKKEPKLSHLDIENIIANSAKEYKKHAAVFDAFLSLLFDAIIVALHDITKHPYAENVYLSGGGASEWFAKKCEEHLSDRGMKNHLRVVVDSGWGGADSPAYSPIFTTAFSLAKATEEMLLLKKDPIARILRYIIYRYE